MPARFACRAANADCNPGKKPGSSPPPQKTEPVPSDSSASEPVPRSSPTDHEAHPSTLLAIRRSLGDRLFMGRDRRNAAEAPQCGPDRRRRPGVFGPGMLWRRDPHAASRCPGLQWAAVHAVLQYSPVLALSRRGSDRLLCPTGAPGCRCWRTERNPRQAPLLGQAPARTPQKTGLPVVPFRKMACGRQAVGQRLRSVIPAG